MRLLELIGKAATEAGAVTFLTPAGDQRVSWAELYADAVRTAAVLQMRGIGPGRPVVILALTSRSVVTAAVATWLAGGSLTMAPTPARTMDQATFLAETVRRVNRLGEPVVLLGPPFDDARQALSTCRGQVLSLEQVVAEKSATEWRAPTLREDDPAIMQLTSGTTDTPKIVRITHANLVANIEAMKAAARHEETHGRLLSWLPLSHDMGLIGAFAAQLTCGRCDLLLASPLDYLSDPASWLRLADRHRATILVGPNSGYALAARLLRTGPRLDLSSVRIALCGGEPIDPDGIDMFVDVAVAHGFDRGAFAPAYGLAEATLAVTVSEPFGGLRVDRVDAEALATDRTVQPAFDGARSRRLARLGVPVPGMSIRIVAEDSGLVLPDRRVGEVQVAGSSVTAGYHDDPSPPQNRRDSEWLPTGDLGYLTDGELVVCGRIKDLIIVAGRNIYAEEVERAACRAEGVRPGNAVAFRTARTGVLGGEGLAVAVESRSSEANVVERDVVAAVRAALGITPQQVMIVSPGSIPKTPSGKLQRAEAARRFAI